MSSISKKCFSSIRDTPITQHVWVAFHGSRLEHFATVQVVHENAKLFGSAPHSHSKIGGQYQGVTLLALLIIGNLSSLRRRWATAKYLQRWPCILQRRVWPRQTLCFQRAQQAIVIVSEYDFLRAYPTRHIAIPSRQAEQDPGVAEERLWQLQRPPGDWPGPVIREEQDSPEKDQHEQSHEDGAHQLLLGAGIATQEGVPGVPEAGTEHPRRISRGKWQQIRTNWGEEYGGGGVQQEA